MAETKSHVDVFQYLGIIRRRKWCVIVPLFLSYIGFLIYGNMAPRIFEAHAIVLIEEKKVVNPLLSNLAVSRTVTNKMNALSEEILAWPRLFQLVERLNLNKRAKHPLDLERLILQIRKNIILRMKTPEILVIAFRGKEPKGTQTLTNTLCDILIQRSESLQTEDTASAIDFIEEQLGVYKKRLEESDEALRKFREIYGHEASLRDFEKKPSVVAITSENEPQEVSGAMAFTKLPLEKINTEIAKYEADLVMAYVDCTDDHPRVKALKERIRNLKQTRDEHIKMLAASAGVDPKSYIEIADSTPRQQEKLISLTRNRTINERIYAMFLERLESAKITESLDQSENRTKFRIIEPARLPLMPVEPNMAKLNLLGILVGCMAGFGCVYLLEYFDSSFKSETDIKEMFGSTVLGSVAKIITERDLLLHKQRTKRAIQVLIAVFFIIFVFFFILNKVAGA